MRTPQHLTRASAAVRRPWDAQLAHRLVLPLKHSWVSPNHLTTLRLIVGVAAAAAFVPGTYVCSNLAALLLVGSNFLDHTDGELARLTGTASRLGHFYDLVSDALVTILLFIAMGIGVAARVRPDVPVSPVFLGTLAGCAVSIIFFLRMRIEEMLGKSATQQASLAGFETEDVLYLVPLVTLCDGTWPLLIAASICAPLFAVWVAFDYRRVLRRERQMETEVAG